METSSHPIIVTGMPRSGTTWVGRLLAKAPGMHYVHEPMNLSAPACACGTRPEYWFQYVTAENGPLWHRHMKHLLSTSPNWNNFQNALASSLRNRRPRSLLELLKSYGASRVVVKDPLALFCAPWLATVFDARIVVTVRHPVAVASSYKRLQWSHPFGHFLAQPTLMNDHLQPGVDEIREFTQGEHEIVAQAALLWKLAYSFVHKHQASHSKWIIVRHEDIAANPAEKFRSLFRQLDLEFTDRVQAAVIESSGRHNPSQSTNPYAIKLDSRATLQPGRDALSSSEKSVVLKRIGELLTLFYPSA